MAFPNMKPVSRSPVLGGVARTVAVEWPNLRFEDGDVAIRLSNEEDGIVILNSSGLSQASGYFKALLSDTWHPAKHVRCADGGIRSFNALKLQYDAHLRMAVLVSAGLSDDDPDALSDSTDPGQSDRTPTELAYEYPKTRTYFDPRHTHLPESMAPHSYTNEPRAYYPEPLMKYYEQLHRALFCALYGIGHQAWYFCISSEAFGTFMVDLYFLADFYLMRDLALSEISLIFAGRHELLLRDIATRSTFWINMAERMQHAPILIEAMKHHTAQYYGPIMDYEQQFHDIPENHVPLATFGVHALRTHLQNLHDYIQVCFDSPTNCFDSPTKNRRYWSDYDWPSTDAYSDAFDECDDGDQARQGTLHAVQAMVSDFISRALLAVSTPIARLAVYGRKKLLPSSDGVLLALALMILKQRLTYFLWDPSSSNYSALLPECCVPVYQRLLQASMEGDIDVFEPGLVETQSDAFSVDAAALRIALNSQVSRLADVFTYSPLFRFCDEPDYNEEGSASSPRVHCATGDSYSEVLSKRKETMYVYTGTKHSATNPGEQQFRALYPSDEYFTFLPVLIKRVEERGQEGHSEERMEQLRREFAHHSWSEIEYDYNTVWDAMGGEEALVAASKETITLAEAVLDGTAEFVPDAVAST